MKVLSIGSDRKLFEEGSSVSVRTTLYGKDCENFSVVVFSLKKHGLSEKKLASNITLYPTNSVSRIFYVWDAIKFGKKIIKEFGFASGQSVVTCQDPFEAGYVGWRIVRGTGIPLHLQVHTDFLSSHFQTSMLQKIRVRMAKFLLPKANYVRVVSKRIVDSFKTSKILLKHEPRVLPVFVDIEKFEHLDPDDHTNLHTMFPQYENIILMASRLTSEKNIDDALLAVARLIESHRDVGLVIAGDGPLKGGLQKNAQALGLEKHIQFLGWRNDVFQLMKTADVFLSSSAYEGYGMSLIESGLAHCPVVSTDVGIAGQILVNKKNSYVCPVGDTMCMYDSLVALLSDKVLADRLAEKLSQDVKIHLPPKEEYAEAYVSLLVEAGKI